MKRIILTTIICLISIFTVFSQDTCPNAIDVTASLTATCNTIPGPFAFAGTPGSLENACGLVQPSTDGIWFTFTAPFSGVMDVTNTNDPTTPDTQVSVYSGGCGVQACLNSDDDGGNGFTSAAMGTPVVAGTQYWIEWTDGWGGAPENMDIRLVEVPTIAPDVTPSVTDAVVNAGDETGNCSVVYDLAPFTPSSATPGIATTVGATITGLTPSTTYTICSFCDAFGDGADLCGYVGNDIPESVSYTCVDFTTLTDCNDPCFEEFEPTATGNTECTTPITPPDPPAATTTDFTICEGDAIPDFVVEETLATGPGATYQVDDGIAETAIGATGADITWGNMFPIDAADCNDGCMVVSFDVGFGNETVTGSLVGTSVTWIIYTDDDGNPTAGLSAPLASGTHTIVNDDFTVNNTLDNISAGNLDICSAADPFLFISLSYTDNTGNSFAAAQDQTASNMQSWAVIAATGTQADWAGGDLIDNFGLPGNWIISANLECEVTCTTNWFDAPTAGNMVGTGTTFNSNGATGEETTTVDTNTPGTYTFYAEADCDGCVSDSRTQITLTIESAAPQCMTQDIIVRVAP